jgi:hypothetical protein
VSSITMQVERFGRLADEATITKATAGSKFKRMVARFQIFLEATVALKRREQREPAASAFHQAALDERIALHTQQAGPPIRSVKVRA